MSERPKGNNADEWMAWFFEHSGFGAPFLAVQIAEAMDDQCAALTAARAEIERLREALKPLAFCDERQPPYGVELDDWTPAVERARAVLSAIEAELGRN